MTTYLIRRLFWLVPVLFTVPLVTFINMRSAPGSPWDTDENKRQVDAFTQKSLEAYYGLDKPMWRQFVGYVIGDWNSLSGDYVCVWFGATSDPLIASVAEPFKISCLPLLKTRLSGKVAFVIPSGWVVPHLLPLLRHEINTLISTNIPATFLNLSSLLKPLPASLRIGMLKYSNRATASSIVISNMGVLAPNPAHRDGEGFNCLGPARITNLHGMPLSGPGRCFSSAPTITGFSSICLS